MLQKYAGGLLLASAVVLLITAVILSPESLAWLRGDASIIGRLLIWLEAISPRVTLTHVLMFGWVAFLLRGVFAKAAWWRLGLLMLALAIVTELLQFMVPGRVPSFLDLLDDMLGAGIGLVLARIMARAVTPALSARDGQTAAGTSSAERICSTTRVKSE